MILIISGAYINQEMRVEFGKIPPAFLPLGNHPLYYFQLKLIQGKFPKEKIYLTIPEDFEVDLTDELRLVNIIKVPTEISLSESILFALNISDSEDETVRILNGDTLFSNLPEPSDTFGISSDYANYDWDYASKKEALTGYFSFKSRRNLIRSLTLAKGSFPKALQIYKKQSSGIKFETIPGWLDLGHLNSYFESRAKITTERAFNSIRVRNGILWKTGTPEKKIRAEAHWFERLPQPLKRYIPQFLGSKTEESHFWYGLEYLPFSPLNELYVNGRQPSDFWVDIFKRCLRIIDDFSRQDIPVDFDVDYYRESLYINKTHDRIALIEKKCNLSCLFNQLGLRDITNECLEKVKLLPRFPAIVHGDFCFSNIMFSSRGRIIKLIDPRGISGDNEITLYGDQAYDLAKVLHSIIGMYDFIIAGKYHLKGKEILFDENKELSKFQDYVLSESYKGVPIKTFLPLVVLLFITMVPLHADRSDRQEAFLINAKRIYDNYLRLK